MFKGQLHMNIRTTSTNKTKLAPINSENTELVVMNFEDKLIEVYKNDSVNVVVDANDESTLYRLDKSNSSIIGALPNSYDCIDIRVNDIAAKVSRKKLIRLMTSKNDVVSIEKTVTTKKTNFTENFDPNKTKIVTDENGTFISNEGITVDVNIDNGCAYNKDTERFLSGTTVYVKYMEDGAVVAKSITIKRLIAMLYGIELEAQGVITLKDESLGYRKENLIITSLSDHMRKSNRAERKLKPIFDKVMTYMTEDFKKFDKKDDALEHQLKIDHAKEISQLVINGKCGYELAEQVFLKTLNISRKDVGYKNFIDMLNNNNGISVITKNKLDVNLHLDSVTVDSDKIELAKDYIEQINQLVKIINEM